MIDPASNPPPSISVPYKTTTGRSAFRTTVLVVASAIGSTAMTIWKDVPVEVTIGAWVQAIIAASMLWWDQRYYKSVRVGDAMHYVGQAAKGQPTTVVVGMRAES